LFSTDSFKHLGYSLAMAKAKTPRGIWTPPPRTIYQLRIALRYIKPPIWRRILVPDNWLLGDLHHVLIPIMGWVGGHMHAFRFGGGFKRDEYSTREMAMECGPQVRDEDTVFLGQVIHRKGQVFTYEYDFGDGWLHEIKVEKLLPYDPDTVLSACLAGARACPPEDCGSFSGYARVLRVLAHAETDEDREFRKWVGPYDPEHFDLEAINRQIQPKKKARSR
jgi:hypothetical protein